MSLYGSKFKIGGVPCGLVMRRGITGLDCAQRRSRSVRGWGVYGLD